MYNINLAKEYKLHSFLHLDIINHFQEETTNIHSLHNTMHHKH